MFKRLTSNAWTEPSVLLGPAFLQQWYLFTSKKLWILKLQIISLMLEESKHLISRGASSYKSIASRVAMPIQDQISDGSSFFWIWTWISCSNAFSIFKLNVVFEFHVIFWVRWIVIKLICHRVLSHLNWFSGDTFGSKVKYFEHFAVCANEKIHASNKTSKSLPNLILDLFEDFLFEVEGYLSFLGYPL